LPDAARSVNAASMARPSTYSPTILPAVKAAAHFGATAEEIASYLEVPAGSFLRWITAQPELREALKRDRDASDTRVVDSLYRRAIGGDVTACIFWLKNRRPSEWRDVQNINADVGHYILSDRPMSEDQWIAERTKVIEHDKLSPGLAHTSTDTDKPLE